MGILFVGILLAERTHLSHVDLAAGGHREGDELAYLQAQLRPPSLLVEGMRMLLRSAEPQPASQTPACSLTCGAASADLGLSAGSPIGLLYDFPEVFFVPLGAFAFRAPLGLFRLPGTLLGRLYAPQPPGVH